MCAHLEQLRRIHTAALLSHVHAHKSSKCAAGILCCVLHGLRLRPHQMRRRHVGVAKYRVLLQLLDHVFVLLGRIDRTHAEGHDLYAAQVRPLFGQHLVERPGNLGRMPRQRRIANAHLGNLRKRGLKRGEQLALELAVDLIAGVIAVHISADVGVKQHRIGHAVAVFAEAAYGNIHVQADVVVHHAEGHRAGRAVFIAGDFLGVEEVHALIYPGLTAKGEAVKGGFQNGFHFIAIELAVKQAGFCVLIEDILAGFGAEFHDLALIHDHHALAVGHGDDAAVGDHVVVLMPAAAETASDLFLRLCRQHVVRQRIHIKVLFPLTGQRAARRVQCR